VTGVSIGVLLREAATRLHAAGIEAPLREARLLLGHAAGLGQTTLIGWPERMVDSAIADRFEVLVERRLAREPVARILGRREFWSLDFTVTPATLDPRPETETVIEAVLAQLPDRQAALGLADFGTGTGCILLALLRELPRARGIGIDRSEAAVRVAVANASALGVAGRAGFVVGDWAAAISGGVDLAVSNPPYIPTAEIARTDPEVASWDPAAALDGGADGLDAYRRLAPEFARILRPGGLTAFETGAGQADAVAGLCRQSGLQPVEIRADLAGIARVVVARKTDFTKITVGNRGSPV
jgi:release factor glutamine methyltransferase